MALGKDIAQGSKNSKLNYNPDFFPKRKIMTFLIYLTVYKGCILQRCTKQLGGGGEKISKQKNEGMAAIC